MAKFTFYCYARDVEYQDHYCGECAYKDCTFNIHMKREANK